MVEVVVGVVVEVGVGVEVVLMDMSDFQNKPEWGNSKRARHLLAIRRNQVSVAEMFLFLAEDPPNASAAKEALDELAEVLEENQALRVENNNLRNRVCI